MAANFLSSAKPTHIQDGLALYASGEGKPVLLMPHPHGMPVSPMIQHPLSAILQRLERQVLTFDPPGAFHSTRPAQVNMEEMLNCSQETLQAFGQTGPVEVVGHSMGGLCALAFCLEYPTQVSRLVLVGSISGFPAIQRGKGMPWGMRKTSPDFWLFIFLGLRSSLGLGNLALHKQMLKLIWRLSYADPSLVPGIEIEPEDKRHPAPIRNLWPRKVRGVDYQNQLNKIQVPVLVCTGRYDPQAPPACSQELAAGIPAAQLVIFERSGHYPYIEEPAEFMQVLSSFLNQTGTGPKKGKTVAE